MSDHPDYPSVTQMFLREYAQDGASINVDEYGMREMQKFAFEKRASQYLLIKAPPASGKSRALKYIALDKLFNQGIKKVIIAVPERSIGKSFEPEKLTESGFFADWEIDPRHNLCTPGDDRSKVDAFAKFMFDADATTLVCTHATLRFAHDQLGDDPFNVALLAIDEFHHVSASEDSRLGEVLRSLIANTGAHIVAMTGSYFRGDALPVLSPRDEAKFSKVTYNYYQQLNGYRHLKTLGIGYHFYTGKYVDAIHEVLDPRKKTIVHIPHVGSAESTKDKHDEVGKVIDAIGVIESQDPETGIYTVACKDDGRRIRIADLVEDDPKSRERVVAYLRTIESADDLDMIIALGMAKEGFDWPWCEHALTVGYRGSLTEVIQIVGRCTRDSENKTHAQFTNLIAAPDANDDEVRVAVNNMLKAITASLLMEQVIAPNFKFRSKRDVEDPTEPSDVLRVAGLKEPSTDRTKQIVEDDLNDLKARVLQDPKMLKAMPGNIDPEVMNKVLIPEVIRTTYPDLTDVEIEEVRQYLVVDSAVKNGEVTNVGSQRFVMMAGKFVNIDELHIDLIDRVNPFQGAFEVLSKSVTKQVLSLIQDVIDATRIDMTEERALILWPKITEFRRANGVEPSSRADDPLERELGEALVWLRAEKRKAAI